MKHLPLTLIVLALVSCSFNPVATFPDGSKVSLGGSMMENTASESASYTHNGDTLTYTKEGKNQTTGPGQIVTGVVANKATGFFAHSTDVKTVTNGKVAINAADNQTTQVLSGNALKAVTSKP